MVTSYVKQHFAAATKKITLASRAVSTCTDIETYEATTAKMNLGWLPPQSERDVSRVRDGSAIYIISLVPFYSNLRVPGGIKFSVTERLFRCFHEFHQAGFL